MIKISEVKKIGEELGFVQIVILGIDEKKIQHVATHGRSKVNAQGAAKMGNLLKRYLSWPSEKCNSRPLRRICLNCAFFRHGDDWDKPKCFVEPKSIYRESKTPACRYFDPNC